MRWRRRCSRARTTRAPSKTRAIVMLEQSRLHELQGNVAAARAQFKTARRTNAQEWKVFLESVLVEVRAREPRNALREAKRALDKHRGTGRLWAVLIQLEHAAGVHQQLRVFFVALKEVPKSGEVWCEGAGSSSTRTRSASRSTSRASSSSLRSSSRRSTATASSS